jgi:CheY-like chemotaxis protein
LERPKVKRTILVVDDDPVFIAESEKLFATAGYRVLQASDGIRAARLLDEMHQKIDLAIIDLALPSINGFELIGALSRRPSGLKIIATSGVYKDAHLESAMALGAHAAIRKPPVIQHIPERPWLSTVRQLIGDPETGSCGTAAH